MPYIQIQITREGVTAEQKAALIKVRPILWCKCELPTRTLRPPLS